MIEHSLMIQNEKKKTVPFILNRAQKVLDDAIEYLKRSHIPIRLYIPKARKHGISSYLLGRGYIKTQVKRNTEAVIMSFESTASQKLLEKVKIFMKYDRNGSPKTHYNTVNNISFPGMDSVMRVATAAAGEDVGRGDTPDFVHFSEAASYKNPQAIVAGLLQGAPLLNSEVYFESTGKQAQSWYHRKCHNAQKAKGIERMLFLPWTLADKYCIKIGEEQARDILANLNDEYDETLLKKNYNLTAGQILWRRLKLDELDYDLKLFKQEFPLTLEECFMSGADNYFYKTNYLSSKRWKRYDKYSHLLKRHPRQEYHYSLGADVAAGVEKDYSTIVVTCVETNEVVYVYACNRIPPDVFAQQIEVVGQMFDWPIAVVESNNHGGVTIDNLLKNRIYPRYKIFFEDQYSTPRAGFNTNRKTKYILLGDLRKEVATNIIFYSSELGAELSAFTENLEAVEGYHDDLVIALALSNHGIEYALKFIAREKKANPYIIQGSAEQPSTLFKSLFGPKLISGLKEQI